jgi:hypothetical protein
MSFSIKGAGNWNEVKAGLWPAKVLCSVYASHDQPLLQGRHFKGELVIPTSKCCSYGHQQTVKWRLRRRSRELIATDTKRTVTTFL